MFKKSVFYSTSILAALAMAMPAGAQVDTVDDMTNVEVDEAILVATDGDRVAVFDEIIVTATKRETTLQETPISVSVTRADTIEKAQILDIKDLQSVVPTLRVSQLQNAMNTNVTIRGFGNGGNNIGIEPAVGMFIDGVYRSRAAAQIGDLPKLERIEVLSGPQTTLFGKNASAGVVSIVTPKPSFESQGYIEGGLGNYAHNYVKAYITGGVSENSAISLGGGYQLRDGYFDSQTAAADMNDLKRFNFRGQYLWEPSDDLSLRVIADMSQIDENCCGTTVAAEGPFNGVSGPTAGNLVNLLGGEQPSSTDAFSYNTYLNKATSNEIDASGVSAQIDYDINDNITLTSITSYRTTGADYDSDSDFNSLEVLKSTFQNVDIDTFTQELRLTGNQDRFDWLLGGYYFDENIKQNSGIIYGDDTRSYVNVLAGSPAILSTLEAFNGYAPGVTFFGDDVMTDEDFTQDDKAFSAFGTVDFDVTDKITLTGGLNYTQDKKKVRMSTVNGDVWADLDLNTANGTDLLALGSIQGAYGMPDDPIYQSFLDNFKVPLTAANVAAVNSTAAGMAGWQAFVGGVQQGVIGSLAGLQFLPQFLAFPNAVEDGRTKDDKLTWTARAAYELNDNWNFYASAGTGFKASSWNLTRDSRPFLANGSALDAADLLPNNYTVATGRNFGTRYAAPEEATVYELGMKARYGNFAFNVAVFDQTIENFQSTTFQGTGFVLSNAGKQSTTGIEFDGTWEPVDALKLTLAATLLDPKYDEFTGAPGPAAPGSPNGTVVDLSGAKPAGIPETSIAPSATWSFDIGDSTSGFIRGDYLYQSKVQVVDNVEGVNRKVSSFNGSIGAEFDNGVSVRLWGRNLLGDEYYTSAFPGVLQFFTANAYPNQPRTYGIALRKDF